MSTTATATQSPSKSKKEKEKGRREKAAQQQTTERLKTVVRRLPPNLPEEIFWQTVQRWVTDETATWKVYYGGKFKKRLNKENIPSRAYIAFKNEEFLMQFSRNESYAIVEYAPHQKVPSEKRKQDSKNNTIEKDEDYISFLESLKAPTADTVTIESLMASTRPPSPPKTTPLLEALKAEKSAQKDKEAILRNHPHYKGQAAIVAITTNPNRKGGEKEAVAPSVPPTAAKGGETAAPASKKAKKAAREAKEAAAQAQKASAAKTAAESKQPAVQAVAGGPTKQSRQQQKQAKHAAPAGPPIATPVILAAKPSTQPPAAAASSAAPPQADAPAPQRRGRAILGRHLEVALAEVGASARARKEREKERAKEAAAADANSTAASTSKTEPSVATGGKEVKDAQPPAAAQPPPSPQRHRNRRGGGPPSGPPNAKAPAIAQRADSVGGAPSKAPAAQPGVIVPPAGLGGPPSERGRGGRPRGRGRGGRGGPAARGG